MCMSTYTLRSRYNKNCTQKTFVLKKRFIRFKPTLKFKGWIFVSTIKSLSYRKTLLLVGKRSVGRPQARWSDDLRRTADGSWMRVAED
jgi:hypothetical protein